jgi:hypothetical protein
LTSESEDGVEVNLMGRGEALAPQSCHWTHLSSESSNVPGHFIKDGSSS